MKGNGLKRRLINNLRLFKAYFPRKNRCQKMMKCKANPLPKWEKWPFFGNFFFKKKRLKKAKNERKWLKTSSFINLRLFRAFFRPKNRCHKMAKSKANALQKWPFFGNFFSAEKNLKKA